MAATNKQHSKVVKNVRTLLTVGAVVLIGLGLKLATQSGLEGFDGSIQNDGYAVSGVLLSGVGAYILGYLTNHNRK